MAATPALNLDQVKAYQDYVQEFGNELLTIALSGFKTQPFLTGEEMTLGKKTWTILTSTARVLKTFSTTYAGGEVFDGVPRTLETFQLKAEMDIVPSNIRKSYLGMYTLPNQEVMPAFLEKMVSYFITRLRTDIDEILWRGNTTGTGVLSTFDGFDKQIADAITATLLTVNVTGLITDANVISAFESTYDLMSDEHKDSGMPLYLYTTKLLKDKYARAYKNAVTKYTEAGKIMTTIFGTDCEIVTVPKWKGTSKVCVTTKDNMTYGYNSLDGQITTIKQHYHIENSATPELGALIMKPWDGEIAVNDQF